jgi:hypothetical protein
VGENEEGAWASSAWGSRSSVARGAGDPVSGVEQRRQRCWHRGCHAGGSGMGRKQGT